MAAFETVLLLLLGSPCTRCCKLLRKAGTKADSPAAPLASTFGTYELAKPLSEVISLQGYCRPSRDLHGQLVSFSPLLASVGYFPKDNYMTQEDKRIPHIFAGTIMPIGGVEHFEAL